MSRTEVDQLFATAKGVSLHINHAQARDLLEARGLTAAAEHLLAAGALATLADVAYDHHLTFNDASLRVDHEQGDYDRAAVRLQAHLEHREDERFNRAAAAAMHRLEERYYTGDARQRQAVFISSSLTGTTGHQASVLLAAAEDAGLEEPGADQYRDRILASVDREVDRRMPDRDVVSVAIQGSRHFDVVKDAVSQERQARRMVLQQLPTMRARIDRMSSTTLLRDVNRALNEIRSRLSKRMVQGWIPDPDRYEREVSALLFDEMRQTG